MSLNGTCTRWKAWEDEALIALALDGRLWRDVESRIPTHPERSCARRWAELSTPEQKTARAAALKARGFGGGGARERHPNGATEERRAIIHKKPSDWFAPAPEAAPAIPMEGIIFHDDPGAESDHGSPGWYAPRPPFAQPMQWRSPLG